MSWEPIAFLHGIQTENGVVISLNRTILEISVVEKLTIKEYEWKYIDSLINECKYSVITQTILELLTKVSIRENNDNMIYLVGDKSIIHNLSKALGPLGNKFVIIENVNEIIVENIFDAPKISVNKTPRYPMIF